MVKLTDAYRSAFKRLNPEQRLAVTETEGPLLVVAGPGTGKTQLLSTRVGYILETTDATPENILCLTFSETAARNMKERLARMIGPDAYEVTVSTYHSFGSDLIQSYREQFGYPFDMKPADDLTLDQTVRSVCNNLDYDNPFKSDYFTGDIKELISGLKRSLITPKLLVSVCKANRQFIEAATSLVREHLADQPRITKTSLAAFKAIFDQSNALPEIKLEAIASLKALWSEELAAALEDSDALNGSTRPITAWKNRWLEKDENNHFIVAGNKANERLIALAQIFKLYNQELETKGIYDYDDMIMKAIKGLETNLDLKYTLQERYQYVMLDEFQDTNESQLRMIELLTDNPVSEARPNVLAVADDDQAIYSFQGAHYSHLRRFLDAYRDVRLVSLKINYRSTPGIIALSSSIREQIELNLGLGDKRQQASDPDRSEELLRVELPQDAEHLAWTAKYISELIKKGEDPSSICVLAPKHRLLQEFIPYLHANNIPVSYERRDNIFEDEIICRLIAMARLAVSLDEKNGAAAALWPEIISYSFWNIPTETIWKIGWQAERNKSNWTELLLAEEQTRAIALFFIRLSQIASYSSFEQAFSYILGREPLDLDQADLKQYTSPFYQYYFNDLVSEDPLVPGDEWKLLGHLSILRSRAREASDTGMNLKEFIEFVDAYRRAEIKIVDSSPFRESFAAVNLATAYGAKGEEYNTVILIDICDEIWGKTSKQRHSLIALPFNLSQVRLDSSSDDERLRLLFVAASRAKTRLVMIGYRTSLSGKDSLYLKYLKETSDNTAGLISPLLPKGARILLPKVKFATIELVRPAWFDRHLSAINSERKALLESKLQSFNLSATKLNRYSDVTKGGPRQFFLDEIIRFPSAPNLSSDFGVAMHKTLDWQFQQFRADKKAPSNDALINELNAQLKKRRLANSDFDQLFKRGSAALSEYFKQTKIVNELDDLSEYKINTNLGTIRLSGEIDRIVINKGDKIIELIDFKTGRPYQRWANEIKPFHHRRQLYFYKLLVELSPQFKGYRVTKGTIQFVEPDPDDKLIHSISLNFEHSEQESLELIMQSVWSRVMALDFPDTSTYPATLTGIRKFESLLLSAS